MSAHNKGTALITGASTGIGAVYAERLARRGYDLILVARNRARLEALAKRITNKTGRAVEVLAADLGNKADLARVETAAKQDASITLLVNNAGVGAAAPLLDSKIEKMEEMITLNVSALTRLTYAVVPGFVTRGTGTIINIASAAAIAPEILNGVYGGTKAYVLAFSHSLQHELANKGIRVQAVLPGAIATEFWDTLGLPVTNLPSQIVMTADNLVDAALTGLDLGEKVTIPSLPQQDDWDKFEAARREISGRLSTTQPAARYGIAQNVSAA